MTRTHRPLRSLVLGEGPALVLLHGFAMQPETYLPLARLLAPRAKVVIPAIFELDGQWRLSRAMTALEATFDDLGLETMSLLGHSFGGGLELALAAHRPERVMECVFADTLGVHARFRLAGEALDHPLRILAMASRRAAGSFGRSWGTHPLQLTAAALWGFVSERVRDMEKIRSLGLPCHVMWASRDSLLSRSSGEEFARRLNATFTVAAAPRIDHDWMFDDPDLFAGQLVGLGLRVFGPGERAAGRSATGPGRDRQAAPGRVCSDHQG